MTKEQQKEKPQHGLGALESPKDPRTFTYAPTTANQKGGERWQPEDIEDQDRVGICTAISLTMRARKHFGIDFSDDFQYLCQKRIYDNNWLEGSSPLVSLKVGRWDKEKGTGVGFLPQKEWIWTTFEDRKLPYSEYVKKLQAVPDEEFERLKEIAHKYSLSAYAYVPVERDFLANAIDATGSLLVRFDVGNEWWTSPIEPLRPPKVLISGHQVNLTNYDGNSFRIANSWGTDWADKGTAYFLLKNYAPTEAWSVWFEEVPEEIQKQIDLKAINDLCDEAIGSINKIKVAIN